MTKKNRRNIIIVIFIVILTLSVVLASIITLDYMKKSLDREAIEADSLRDENEALSEQIDGLLDDKAELEKMLDQLEAEISRLGDEISLRDAEITELIEQCTAGVADIETLNERIERLAAENAEAQALIDTYEAVLAASAGYRTEPITKLMTHLLSGAPMRLVEAEGQEDVPEDEREYVEVYPNLAYCYYDLSTGYSVSYNSDEVMYSASLIKALYIYSVLREIEAFEEKKHNFDSYGNPLYDENGAPLFEGEHPNYNEDGDIIYLAGEEKYDLSREWIYDKETMHVGGSGEIRHMDDGLRLTWDELFDYTLRYSDNVAFKQIRDSFGYVSFYNTVGEFGLTGPRTGFMNLTANDCVIFLKALYGYFDEGGKYADAMRTSMINSLHTVMISCCYPAGTVAHKYGWDHDAYHDMAIVYDTHPYILVIMTDLDTGGNTVNTYIRGIVDCTKQIHQSAYSGGK